MNPDTLIVVHCYFGDQDRVETLLPVHLSHGCPVLLLSPEDAPVDIKHPQVTCRTAGRAGWVGSHTLDRQVAHWRIVQEFPQEFVLLHDSDSICLTPELPDYLYKDPRGVWATIIGTPGYLNYQPPFFMVQRTLAELVWLAENTRTGREVQSIDGFYSHLIQDNFLLGRCHPDGLHGLQYGFGTGKNGLERACERISQTGGPFVHGVKTATDLQFLQAARRSYELKEESSLEDQSVSPVQG